jgi:hypothetical protein
MDNLLIAKHIDSQRTQIVDRAVVLTLHSPFWAERFGPGIGERLAIDFDMNLAAVSKAIRYRSPMILNDHMRWRRGQIIGLGCSTGHLREALGYKWSAISTLLPQGALPTIRDYLELAASSLAYPLPAARAVAAAHDQLAEALTAASFDTSWHWQVAYGEAGRAAALRDSRFLFAYAIDALGSQQPAVLDGHIRYRRDGYLAAGLSSIHIQQLLWLAGQIAEAHLAPGPAAELCNLLEAAAGFLGYESESCAALVAAQERIVAEVAEELIASGLAAQPELAAVEVSWYLAYLTDSLAARDPAGLVGYARWMRHYFAAQGMPDTRMHKSFSALDGSLGRHLPRHTANAARGIIGAAQLVL